VPKFRQATPPNSEVISVNLLHFKPIFDPPLKKVVRGAAVSGGGCASKTWWFSSACKNLGAQHPLGAEIWSSENCTLRGYDFTSKSPRSLDQTREERKKTSCVKQKSFQKLSFSGGLTIKSSITKNYTFWCHILCTHISCMFGLITVYKQAMSNKSDPHTLESRIIESEWNQIKFQQTLFKTFSQQC